MTVKNMTLGDILRDNIERNKGNPNYLRTEQLLLSPNGVEYLIRALQYIQDNNNIEAPDQMLHSELMIQLKCLKQPV